MKTLRNLVPFLLIVFVSLQFPSCKKDDNNDNPFSPTSPTLKTTVLGTVKDTDGKVMSGVTVKLSGYTTITDQRGMFVFRNSDVPKDRMVLKATYAGYFNCIKGKKTQAGAANYVTLIMQEKPLPVSIQSGTGGTVNLPGGAQITFPANAFTDANGNAYTGTVNVYARHISTANDNFESIVPGGDLLGFNANGQIKSLYSMGMLEALLTDNSGVNKIKLAAGKTAEIKFPIDPSQSTQALATIPMWHLDESTGIWIEEGQATKNGNFFTGNVSHFSTWNCDYQGERTDIIGKVVDCQGIPLAGIVVTINNFLTVTTNNAGEYTTWVPSGYVISCQALVVNNPFLLNDSPIQTITAQGGILNIIPDIVASCNTRISGTVSNCTGTELSNAILLISWNGGMFSYYTNSGTYSNIMVPNEQNITITALYQNQSGTKSIFTGIPGTTSNIPNIAMCNTSAINPIGFNAVVGGVYTYYIVTPTNIISDFVDQNADGVFESATITVNGFVTPTLAPCTMTFNLNTETNGYYSMLSSSQNSVFITIGNLNTFANGLHGNVTSNKFTVSEYGTPGGLFNGIFEFDWSGGIVTNGTLSVPR